MPIILAIEPDRRQAAHLAGVVRQRVMAELILAETTEGALDAIGNRVPDMVLVPALLSPQDDAALAAALRVIAAAAHVRTLTIPVLATGAKRTKPAGMLAKWRRGRAAPAPDGCDPSVFADQINAYLQEAAAERAAVEPDRDGVEIEPVPIDSPQPVVVATTEAVEPTPDAIAWAAPEPFPFAEPESIGFSPTDSSLFAWPEPITFADPEPILLAAPDPVPFAALDPVADAGPDPVAFVALDAVSFEGLDPIRFATIDPVPFAALDPVPFATLDPVSSAALDPVSFAALDPVSFAALDPVPVATPDAIGFAVPAQVEPPAVEPIEAAAALLMEPPAPIETAEPLEAGALAECDSPAASGQPAEGTLDGEPDLDLSEELDGLSEGPSEEGAVTGAPVGAHAISSAFEGSSPDACDLLRAGLEQAPAAPSAAASLEEPVVEARAAEACIAEEELVEPSVIDDTRAEEVDTPLSDVEPWGPMYLTPGRMWPDLDGVQAEPATSLGEFHAPHEEEPIAAVVQAEAEDVDTPLSDVEPWGSMYLTPGRTWPHLDGVQAEPATSLREFHVRPEEKPIAAVVQAESEDVDAPLSDVEPWGSMYLTPGRMWPRLDGVQAEPATSLRGSEARHEADPIAACVQADVVQPAAPTTEPAPAQVRAAAPAPKVNHPEWLALVASLRQDIERLHRKPASMPAPPIAARSAKPGDGNGSHRIKKQKPFAKKPRPLQDEWGLFDPEQCGFSALLAKLEEITAAPEETDARG